MLIVIIIVVVVVIVVVDVNQRILKLKGGEEGRQDRSYQMVGKGETKTRHKKLKQEIPIMTKCAIP